MERVNEIIHLLENGDQQKALEYYQDLSLIHI